MCKISKISSWIFTFPLLVTLVTNVMAMGCYAIPIGHVEYIELEPISPETFKGITEGKQDYCHIKHGFSGFSRLRQILDRAYETSMSINIGAIGLSDFALYEHNQPSDSLPAVLCTNLSGNPVYRDDQ